MPNVRESDADTLRLLTQQHRDIEVELLEVLAAPPAERGLAFATLRRSIVLHETFEREALHPWARSVSVPEAFIEEREREESEIDAMLAELGELRCDAPEFVRKLETLWAAFVAHARAEELREVAPLSGRESTPPERLSRTSGMSGSPTPHVAA